MIVCGLLKVKIKGLSPPLGCNSTPVKEMPVLQNLYGLSDEALEFQVTDRLTFVRFFAH